MTVAEGLRKFSLFKSFLSEELEQLSSFIIVREFSAEQVVIEEGTLATDFYLVSKGAIGVLKNNVNIAWMEEGDYFGEMALLSGRTRDATVVTLTPCLLYQITKDVFDKFLHHRLDVIFDFAQTLDKRLRHHNHLVVSQYESLKALYDESKRNEDFFRFLNEGVHDAIIVFENNNVTFFSQRVYEVLGIPLSEKPNFSNLIHYISGDSVKLVTHALKEDYEGTFEVEGVKSTKEIFPLELRLKLVNFQGRQLRVCVLRDLTEIKNRELLIENQKMQMAQSAKMALLGEMASGIAHELNNPLTIIDGFANVLERHAAEPMGKGPEIKKIADTIQQMTERISKIIMGLRSFARDGSKDDFEQAILAQIIKDTTDFLKVKKMKMTVEVIVEDFSPDLMIECRAVQISEVLLNLVSNSFDAVAELSERWVKLSVEEKSESIILKVTDSGKGIPAPILAKIFEPFYTTKPVGKGTGLGMSISKKIIEDHGGTLIYNNTSDHTQFIIELPRKQRPVSLITSKAS